MTKMTTYQTLNGQVNKVNFMDSISVMITKAIEERKIKELFFYFVVAALDILMNLMRR